MRFPIYPSLRSWGGRAFLAVPVVGVVIGTAFWQAAPPDSALTAVVTRGDLVVQLTTTGVLRPVQALTYRSPVIGREIAVAELIPEGTRVREGEVLARLDTAELERDLDRARQEVRQAQANLQVAEIDLTDAEAASRGVSEGEGALSVDEAKTRLEAIERRVERLREEHAQLAPLFEKGFMTREELRKTADALEQAEDELALARRRTTVVAEITHPRDQHRAALLLAQKRSQLEAARARVAESSARLGALTELIEACSIRARGPGLVVYEEYLNANPRRKLRVGDRVVSSQGLVTIPEVDRMVIEASVAEAELHRVRAGQTATVRVEAFPDLRLDGRVVRVGTLARSSLDRPFDEKRFDLVIEIEHAATELRPEMTARADILVTTRPKVLLVPVNAVFEEQGTFVARVPSPAGTQVRSVTLGESNDRFVEVRDGLHEGERVMLVDAPSEPGSTPAAAASPTTAADHAAPGH